ncbi:putative tRNA-dihydrouridine synthase [Polystyrenella longa]|uniref:tRNA-dihydrouridine synthase n=1 Tax=Polystyrenella longa TaxID=2528007 RepID=A0A518CQ43_9PLAN|nr:tRNA dihydrouridine synthase DusB [Polystyrenella longa]QDU81338.1 putative tRNA-dihydrouridine synthase [Polystyrenella longa]
MSPFPEQPIFPEPLHYGPLKLPSRYLLSPLAGFTNLSFRRVIREIGGVGLATTDLVNARGLLEGSRRSLQMIESHPTDRPFAVQIFGSDPIAMRDVAIFLEQRGIDTIDINMGCPVNRIVKGGAGASMMCSVDKTVALVQGVVEAVSIPVTVKMRLGWDDSQLSAPFFSREFEQVGVAAVAIHGRTREQGFSGSVNRDGIRKVVEAVDKIPVIGNGDVLNIEDAATMLRETGCHGVSIGRGALANPWIFRQLSQWETTGQYDSPGNFEERLSLMMRQFGYLEEQHGIKHALIAFRKMGHWYLKGMRVKPVHRHEFQMCKTREELMTILQKISELGPNGGTKTGLLPDMHVPVPSGAVERW